jgi:predicted HTH transcriptional regulator
MDPELIKIILGGGGTTGIAAVLFFGVKYGMKLIERQQTIISNHIEHNTAVLATQVETNRSIAQQVEETKECIRQNTTAMMVQTTTNKDVDEAVKDLTILIRTKL